MKRSATLATVIFFVLAVPVSAFLAVLGSNVLFGTSFRTPGMIAARLLVTRTTSNGFAALGSGLRVELGVDTICWLAILWASYFLVRRRIRWTHDERNASSQNGRTEN